MRSEFGIEGPGMAKVIETCSDPHDDRTTRSPWRQSVPRKLSRPAWLGGSAKSTSRRRGRQVTELAAPCQPEAKKAAGVFLHILQGWLHRLAG